ncbi:MAG: hypothetical protein LBK77_04980 [Spirochaetaceae bacterium]|jgi:hypothetical protein|nr:hypothetical protein [Spirochaetaceae bacterium]
MAKDVTNLEVLSTRSGFNSAVRHIKRTIAIMENAGSVNLADLLYQSDDEEMSGDRAGLVLSILLVDKMGYKAVSANLASVAADLSSLSGEFEKWKGVDLIVAYHHPELGLLVANPKIAEELAAFGSLRKQELLVVYAGRGGAPADDNCRKAAELAISLFEGAKVKAPAALLKGGFTAKPLKQKALPKAPGAARAPRAPKAAKKTASARTGRAAARPVQEAQRVAPPVVTAAAPPAAAPTGPVKMTPRYAVVVQNELFHNGNVEAWKRIVASYNAAHPDLTVYIYYEGERILDINSLFKWGKVKHGSAIEFAVAGNEIKDVAKLQRYLSQGASHQFEAFLHGPVNNVLKLF